MFNPKTFIAPILVVSILLVPPTVTVLATGVDSGYASALVGQEPPQEPPERCKYCKEDCFEFENARYESCMEGTEWWEIPERAWCWYQRHTKKQGCEWLVPCVVIEARGEDRCDIEQLIEDEFGG